MFWEAESQQIECLDDKIHDMTTSWNAYFREDKSVAGRLLVTLSNESMDLLSLAICFLIVFYSYSFRYVISLAIFYGLRASLQVSR